MSPTGGTFEEGSCEVRPDRSGLNLTNKGLGVSFAKQRRADA
jgi:hypothetical protein